MNALLATDVMDTLRESVVILAADGTVARANRAFLATFQHAPSDLQGRRLWDLDDGWRKSGLHHLLSEGIAGAPDATLENVELFHDFLNGTGYRHLMMNARHLGSEGMFVTFTDYTDVDRVVTENCHLRVAVASDHAERAKWLRDVLAAATEQKLRLCLTPDEMPPTGSHAQTVPLTLAGLKPFRHKVRAVCAEAGMESGRIDDFENAVGEAAMNAVVHTGAGEATLSRVGDATVQVRVCDTGAGIPMSDLPRALLEKGFSSKGTMGQGLKIILQTTDRIYLTSGEQGTTLVLEQDRDAPLPPWMFSLPDFDL